ncbi:MAG: DUF4446 family protein [Patescibacteria group bacterium]|nr:DUF4446 family protein [Patescibacteria group bacterium]
MFKFLKKNKEPQNMKEMLTYVKVLEKNIKEMSMELEKLKKESKFSIQKMGIVRYNPFSSVGSNQSFSIALLDWHNNGTIITSLYSKDGSRVYGKPIEKGVSEYSLSQEEKKAIEKAINPKTTDQ